MPSVTRHIWRKFHVHRRDNPPYHTWAGDRIMIAELFQELGFKVGAEIGVYMGHYSTVICQKNPEAKLYCIDPWDAYYYYTQTSKEKAEGIYAEFVKNIGPFKNQIELVRKISMEAVKEFKDDSLDFIYIDGLHDFDNIMLDLIHWVPKVRVGGIVSGHDYAPGYMLGVIPAVDVYTRMHNVSMYYVTNERHRELNSFFWVKE